MRQVFTSPRLENVEAVAALLRAEGIQVKISEDRSYRGNRRSNFSYRDGEATGAQPSVWIIHAEDQPRGRKLLREAGLLESSRAGESSYLPLSSLHGDKPAAGKDKRVMWTRIGLLLAIIVVLGLIVFSLRESQPAKTIAAPAPAKPANPAPVIVPQSADDLEAYRVTMPTALAKLLVENAIAAKSPAQACIAIDGKDPSPQFMSALKTDAKTRAFVASQCPGKAAFDLDVRDYMTNGSGTGNVQLILDGDDAKTIDVEREGAVWRVLRRR